MLKMTKLKRMVFVALLAAMAVVLMYFGVALIPAAHYLKYEPSGAIILICGLLLGPGAAAQCAFVKCVLYFIVHGGSPYGHISDLIATLALCCLASALNRRFTATRPAPGKIPACLAGVAAATILMIPANYVILYLQYGMTPDAVSASMIYVIPYNILKAGLNSVIALILYEPVFHALSHMEASKG